MLEPLNVNMDVLCLMDDKNDCIGCKEVIFHPIFSDKCEDGDILHHGQPKITSLSATVFLVLQIGAKSHGD